jgi:hypothetical protein
MPKRFTLQLDARDVFQLLDGLKLRAESWERTADLSFDNSPALQGWDWRPEFYQVPEGRQNDRNGAHLSSLRDFRFVRARDPALKRWAILVLFLGVRMEAQR